MGKESKEEAPMNSPIEDRLFTLRYFVTVIVVILGGSAQFYSYGIVNPAQIVITAWINSTYSERYSSHLSLTQLNLIWSLVVSAIAIGAILGALSTRHVAEKFGRRNGLILNGVLNIMGALLELLAKPLSSPELLICGRFALGYNMGLTSGLIPMYLMEITPTKYRGQAGTLHQVAVAFSDWFSLLLGMPEVLGDAQLWPIAFAFPGIPALILVMVLPFSPESPKYLLVTKNDKQGALKSCQSLVVKKSASLMYEQLIKEHVIEQSDGEPGTFRELFTLKSLRVPLIASSLVMLSQQFTGCTAVFAYSTDMFLHAKLDLSVARYSTLAIGIGYFLCAFSAPFLIERVGRRPLLLFQLCACLLSLILMSLFTALQNYDRVEWASEGTIFALVLYMCVYGVGSPIPWMITSELFTQKYRATAVTVSVFIAWTLAFFISAAYLPFQQLVGVSFSYLPFIIVMSISIVFIFFLLPETRGRAASHIVEEVRYRSASLSAGRPWKAVKSSSRSELERILDPAATQHPSYSSLNEGS